VQSIIFTIYICKIPLLCAAPCTKLSIRGVFVTVTHTKWNSKRRLLRELTMGNFLRHSLTYANFASVNVTVQFAEVLFYIIITDRSRDTTKYMCVHFL